MKKTKEKKMSTLKLVYENSNKAVSYKTYLQRVNTYGWKAITAANLPKTREPWQKKLKNEKDASANNTAVSIPKGLSIVVSNALDKYLKAGGSLNEIISKGLNLNPEYLVYLTKDGYKLKEFYDSAERIAFSKRNFDYIYNKNEKEKAIQKMNQLNTLIASRT